MRSHAEHGNEERGRRPVGKEQAIVRISAWFARKVPLEQLSRLCWNLGVCLSAGMTVLEAMQTCQRTAPDPMLRVILRGAIERVADGMELADAMEPWRERFPAFFLPVLRCGDRSGRMEATLDYLKEHCHLLAGPARVARNTWLVPLCIMLFGSVVSTVIYLVFASFWAAVHYAIGAATFYVALAAGVIAARRAPFFKPLADRAWLLLPAVWDGPRGCWRSIDSFTP